MMRRRMARSLVGQGARCVIAKLGPGARSRSPPRERTSGPRYEVEAVDTTAAGDAWNGAFAVALAEGRTVQEAGAFANAAAAISVTRAGAQPSMATRDEVAQFRAQKERP